MNTIIRSTADTKEDKEVSTDGMHFGLNLWREMAKFTVEEGGTKQVVDTQTRWNRYHNMFFMNINTLLDTGISVCYQYCDALKILLNEAYVFYIFSHNHSQKLTRMSIH